MATAAQQNAAAVLTSYIDYEMVPTAFQALAAKNIRSWSATRPHPGREAIEGSAVHGRQRADNLFSQLMAYLTIADSKGKANVIVIKLTDSASTTKAGNIEIAS